MANDVTAAAKKTCNLDLHLWTKHLQVDSQLSEDCALCYPSESGEGVL